MAYHCDLCGKSFINESTIVFHIQMHIHVGTTIRKRRGEVRNTGTCEVCNVVFSNVYTCARHMEMVHEQNKPFRCEICDRRFSNIAHLKAHMGDHIREMKFACHICGKTFAKNVTLVTHVHSHTGEKPFQCEECGRSFVSKGNLASHRRGHNGERDRQYSCDKCDKRFYHKSHLESHIRSHRLDNKFTCKHCPEAFRSQTALLIHVRIHNGKPQYTCAICDKSYISQSSLNTHMLRHTNEKEFKCDHCGKAFTVKCGLDRHLLIHTGEQPYKCVRCERAFNDPSSLARHALIHSNENKHTFDMSSKSTSGIRNNKKPVLEKSRAKKTVQHKWSLQDHLTANDGAEKRKKMNNMNRYASKHNMMCHVKKRVKHEPNNRVHIPSDENDIKAEVDLFDLSVSDKCKLENDIKFLTEAIPLICGICDETFTDQNVLDRHGQIHTWENCPPI